VDGALPPVEAAPLEQHLAGCAACRGQASAERSLRVRVLGKEGPPPPPGFAERVMRRVQAEPHALDEPEVPTPWLLALAAGAGLLGALVHSRPGGRPS
jgi:anti-sigma factor RsiW